MARRGSLASRNDGCVRWIGETMHQCGISDDAHRTYVISKMNQHRLKDDVLTFQSKMKDRETIQLEMKYA
jgi:hypothetical protein